MQFLCLMKDYEDSKVKFHAGERKNLITGIPSDASKSHINYSQRTKRRSTGLMIAFLG